ncbi:MAG: PD-(D/E)XK nuclease family protein [bacterium]|nr:PD-(D/E)XK nuclease family protein [bacterium]
MSPKLAKRIRNIYDPKAEVPYQLSRSKIDLFVECPRCFYLDRKLGVGRPDMPGFTLNIAVDHLLKKEFDIHRANKEAHPLMKQYGIKAVPFEHVDLNKWRENFVGMQILHKPTNLLVTGAIDDIWINDKNELHIVDYKATSTKETITLEGEYKEGYKRQMEIYEWLFRRAGFIVSNLGYFVYMNGRKDERAFDGKLEFDVQIISYNGNDSWVEQTIVDIKKCLDSSEIPVASEKCKYCSYVFTRLEVEK